MRGRREIMNRGKLNGRMWDREKEGMERGSGSRREGGEAGAGGRGGAGKEGERRPEMANVVEN